VTLSEGEALIIPANVIYLVETVGESIALGVNFITLSHLGPAIDAYQQERLFGQQRNECFPRFDILGLCVLQKFMVDQLVPCHNLTKDMLTLLLDILLPSETFHRTDHR
jgi:hypothetical protein